MKFTKFGKALLVCALSVGVIFGVTSCIRSYTVGFLYVTGTVTAQSGNNGIISGYKIDHNTGKLAPINGLPVSTGGANPVRAILLTGSRFVYVLNRGTNSAGNGDCTTADPCQNSNITQFAVGGNGVLTYQETFYTQGMNPFRLIGDPSGNFILALDHDSPSSAACGLALGTNVTACGDVTVFSINQTTGRLSLIQNTAVTQANCPTTLITCPLTYFPVPSNPIDFVLTSGFLLTLYGTPTSGDYVYPYAYSSSGGQLTLSQSGVQPITNSSGATGTCSDGTATSQPGIAHCATAIISASSVIYVLDNEPITATFNGNSVTSPSQILPFTVGTGGALQADTGGIIPDDPTLSNPIQVLVESKGKYLYIANQGNEVTGNNPESGISAYFITTTPAYQLSFVAGEPFGSGSGPQCIVEDPSDQFIYEANQYDSTITGRVLDPNSGELDDMRSTSTYTLQGPPTWCFVDGRTG